MEPSEIDLQDNNNKLASFVHFVTLRSNCNPVHKVECENQTTKVNCLKKGFVLSHILGPFVNYLNILGFIPTWKAMKIGLATIDS